MKHLIVLVFTTMVLGCAAEAEVIEKPAEAVMPSEHSYPSQNNAPGITCPTPLVFTIMVNGKDEKKIFYPPCYTPTVSTSKATDPPGWGENGSLNDSFKSNPGYKPGYNPPGDPIPRKF